MFSHIDRKKYTLIKIEMHKFYMHACKVAEMPFIFVTT